MNESKSESNGLSRRDFIKGSAVAAAFPAAGAEASTLHNSAQENSAGQRKPNAGQRKPNIVLYISDQFRWDMVSAYGLNPMQLTPNLDAMAQQRHPVPVAHHQPAGMCTVARRHSSPANTRTSTVSGATGLDSRPMLSHSQPNFAKPGTPRTTSASGTSPRSSLPKEANADRGRVVPEERGGFLDFWEGSNELEWTSHPYEGEIYDGAGKAIPFSDIYRADFITQRAKQFLNTVHGPFLLVISQLEVHHQNDCNCFVGPKEYAGKFTNPFVPGDLRDLPGDWQKQLPDYCGAVKSIDDSVGEIRKTLAERGLEDDTIFLFLSDHGCHFRTRNAEYKRSPHESSIHVPLVIQGPGFDRSLEIPELTSQIDITPTLLSAAGLPVPASMQGRSFLPLLERKVKDWRERGVHPDLRGGNRTCSAHSRVDLRGDGAGFRPRHVGGQRSLPRRVPVQPAR